jgi:DNA-binding transcriptional MerR regulator
MAWKIVSRVYQRPGIDSVTFHCYDTAMSRDTNREDWRHEKRRERRGDDRIARDERKDEDAAQPLGADMMTLGELTDAADVSVRTVRYYIAEGLLPPPERSGPRSAYTAGHFDRLRLIQQLKNAYLPLKEIRRRLAGLDDEAVRSLLAAGDEPAVPGETWQDPDLAGAREYLSMMETRERYRTEPMALPLQTPLIAESAFQPEPRAGGPEPARTRGPRAAGVFATGLAARPEQDERNQRDEGHTSNAGLWHRLALGDEAELVISERVYSRHRDRVDWLVRWARKVFG